MTSVQLAQRLLRYLTVKDLSLLDAADSLHLLDAINGAIQEYYVLVPSMYKRTTFSGQLLGPQTVTLGVTNESNVFTGWAPDESMKGFTIVVSGDSRQNTIIGANLLQDVYTGPTGTTTATVYGDVLQLDQIIQRLTSDPVNVDTGQMLYRDENFKRRSAGNYWGDMSWFYLGLPNARRIGCPHQYWIEGVGASQGATPPFLLRVNTLPDQNYRFRVDGDLAPMQLGFADLIAPANLPVDNFVTESTIVPMAAERLTDSPLWQNKDLIPVVATRAQNARQMTSDRPPNIGAATNRVLTPAGF